MRDPKAKNNDDVTTLRAARRGLERSETQEKKSEFNWIIEMLLAAGATE